MYFQCGCFCYVCDWCLLVMGIFNVMFDLFFDGGQYVMCDVVLCYVEKLIVEGVDMIDIGGELSWFGVELLSL